MCNSKGGFTILEMLVVLGVFAVFGTVLAMFMRFGVINWRITSERITIEQEAETVLDQIRSDLLSAVPRNSDTTDRRVWYTIYSGSRQITRFSALPPRELREALKSAGNGLDDDGDGQIDEEFPNLMDSVTDQSDGVDDDGDGETDEEALNGVDDDLDGQVDEDCFGDGLIDEDCVRPMSLFPKISYMTDPFRLDGDGKLLPPRPILWRSIDWGTNSPFLPDDDEIHKLFVPLSRRCLFLEFRYALTQTNTWSTEYPPDPDAEICGPEIKWDNKRLLDPIAFGTNIFPEKWKEFAFRSNVSPVYADEWVYPRKVLVIIGIVPDTDPYAYLTQSVDSNDMELYLDTTDGLNYSADEEERNIRQYLLIDREWICFESASGGRVTVHKRGARFSNAASHYEDTPVYFPRVFATEVYIPTGYLPR
ncbi:MAG: type II secretion system protein [Planctomycetota bacterium]|nr:type II secretion system protein [Planctomycetota bacterium]